MNHFDRHHCHCDAMPVLRFHWKMNIHQPNYFCIFCLSITDTRLVMQINVDSKGECLLKMRVQCEMFEFPMLRLSIKTINTPVYTRIVCKWIFWGVKSWLNAKIGTLIWLTLASNSILYEKKPKQNKTKFAKKNRNAYSYELKDF